jgi:cholesterol oxidase
MSPAVPAVTRRRLLGQAALATAAASVVRATPASAREAARESQEYVPAIVVGSGYGGSVAALRLGEAGVRTLVLEMGRLWNRKGPDGKIFCPTLLPDGRAMWFRNKTKIPLDTFGWVPIDLPIQRAAGILDRLQFADIGIYVGRGVGGGSLVNGSVAATPRREDFERFMPSGVDVDAMYATWFPRARAALGVNSFRPEWVEQTPVHRYSRVGRQTAARAGFSVTPVPSVYDADYLEREAAGLVRPSATAQEIYYGSNHGKRSLDKTYLADALGTGNVTIAAMSRVTRIQRDGARYLVSVEEITILGKVVRRRQIACDHLFLGAGTMGTAELLLRARETGDLPDLTDRIGQGWGNNGNVSVSCLNPTSLPTGVRQSTMPAWGIDQRADPVNPVFCEVTGQPTGFENFTTSYLGVTETGERATLSFDRATGKLDLDWNRSQADPAIARLRSITDRIVAKNGMTYRHDIYAGNRAFGVRSAWHPLGGCTLGDATDLFGRVHGARNLYVTDGSLIPGFASVNPMLTITAVAERCVDTIVREDIVPRR